MNNILITGGAGFIGSNLSLKLLKKGYSVTVLDNLSKQIHGENAELPLDLKGKVTFIKGDVRDKDDWRKAMQGQDIIVHLAAETGTGQSMYEINKYAEVNICGTANMLDILVNENHSIEKIILASSRAIYGEGKYSCKKCGIIFPNPRRLEDLLAKRYEPICPSCGGNVKLMATEEKSKIHPSSVYGITKFFQEQIIINVCKNINMPFTILRYQNVYGPGQSLKNPYTGILSIFSTRIKNGKDIIIFEDGKESRDFVYIEDVIMATTIAIINKDANYKIINIGTGKNCSIYDIASILKKYFRKNTKIEISNLFRLGDIRHNYADISESQGILGYYPKYNIEKGLKYFVKWVESQNIENDILEQSIKEMQNRKLLYKSEN